MKSRLGKAILIITGSMLFYCGQDAVTQMGHGKTSGSSGGRSGDGGGGPIGDAAADATCCTPPDPETPTVLFDGQITPTPMAASDTSRLCTAFSGGPEKCCTAVTPSWDVSAYRTVVIHMDHCFSGLNVQYKYGGAGFVNGPTPACSGDSLLLTVDPRLGKLIRLNYASRTDASYPDGFTGDFGTGICSNTTPENVTVVGLKY